MIVLREDRGERTLLKSLLSFVTCNSVFDLLNPFTLLPSVLRIVIRFVHWNQM